MKSIPSPFSDKTLCVQTRPETITFRKEEFEVVYHYYEDAGQQFTTDETDELNLKQAYNQYRGKHNLPFADEIREIREKYQLSAVKMAEVLGFGINIYRQYESGEVPNQSNARLIEMAKNPLNFKDLVEDSNIFSPKDLEKIIKRINHLIEEEKQQRLSNYLKEYVLGSSTKPNVLNGYRMPSLSKTLQVIGYFIEKLNPTKTGLNKLLFYADFLHYRQFGVAMMGLEYRAISYGTVPSRFDSLIEFVAESGYINRQQQVYKNGNLGETYSLGINFLNEENTFSEEELEILNTISTAFKDKTPSEIVAINHKEKAWIENEGNRGLVDYRYAFGIVGLEELQLIY
jgi:DNA-binding transcriptional regulator YiaG